MADTKKTYFNKKYGIDTVRRTYQNQENYLEIPNLLSIQEESFKKFISSGVKEIFEEIYPIISNKGNIKIEYLGHMIEMPKNEYEQIKFAKQKGSNYFANLVVTLKLTNDKTGEVKTSEVQFAELPLMIKGGSFVINGSERVIISQILRSPGIYVENMKTTSSQSSSDDGISNGANIIPNRGAWIEFDYKDYKLFKTKPPTMKVRIDKSKRMNAMIIFTAFGLKEKTILNLFDNHDLVVNSCDKFFITPAMKITEEETEKSIKELDKKIKKFAKKPEEDRNFTKKEIALEKYMELRTEKQTIENNIEIKYNQDKDGKAIKPEDRKPLSITDEKESTKLDETLEILKDEYIHERYVENARTRMFKMLNPGDRSTINSINNLFSFLLFNRRRYDLSRTGRYKFNISLNVISRIVDKIIAEDIKDAKGKVIFKEGTLMDLKNIDILTEHIKKNNVELVQLDDIDTELYNFTNNISKNPKNKVHIVKIYFDNNYKKEEEPRIISIIGNDPSSDELFITIPDIIATLGLMLNIEEGFGNYDDIDSLNNRRIRTVSELLTNQLRIGLSKIEKNTKERISAKDTSLITVKNVTNNKLLRTAFREFFNSSQLSQFMDQINPLAELSNKRRITALGPGGLSRETASLVVRGIHDTHYGRLCPIETPEGPNIGLILNLALYGKVDEFGFIRSPYNKVLDGVVTKDIVYMLAEEEKKYFISQKNIKVNDKNEIVSKMVIARNNGKLVSVDKKIITHIDVSPKQLISLATSCIPFLENDDANRALMGANMQRQGLPLIKPEAPLVATGSEELVAKYVSTVIKSNKDGVIDYVDGKRIDLTYKDKTKETFHVSKFERSNQATSINQTPKVRIGQKVKKNEIIADGPSIDNGELAIGQNVLVAFTTWRGYNYEDAIAISDRLVEDDVYTSIYIDEHTIECRNTRIGPEIITNEIPNVSLVSKRHLGEEGIVVIGSEVKAGDMLVGKITPKGEEELSPEEKLLDTILGNKVKNMRDTSLRVKNGGDGTVHDVRILDREKGDKLDDGVNYKIKIFIARKRKIKVGDKMAGRHGNKGVISIVLPKEDMPFMEDGTPVDIMLNPLGVPSRMNIGQILELHLGMAAKKLGIKVAVPPFDGENNHSLEQTMIEAGLDPKGKVPLTDGITGEKFDNLVSVGYMYMLKLSHMIDDKMHSRSVGPYSLITQQPLGGKSQNGGQRFGEMEAWSLEGYGASNLLQEMFTLKSDDIKGRNELYNAIANGRRIPKPNLPEGFWVLNHELKGLGLNLEMVEEDGTVIEFDKDGNETESGDMNG